MSEYPLYLEEKLPKGYDRTRPGHNDKHFFGQGRHKKSPTYQSWYCMVMRTVSGYRKDHDQSYVTQEIKVCIRWSVGDGNKCGFFCFLEDMGERPDGMSLGRKGDVGHYTPENCEWQTPGEQGATRSRKRKVA